jgi:hypothetical protein
MEDIRKGVCPVCDHREILEATPQVNLGDWSHSIAPKRIHMNASMARKFLLGFKQAFGIGKASGEWRAYACGSCGYAQIFVVDCANVEVSQRLRTRLIRGPESSSPYR